MKSPDYTWEIGLTRKTRYPGNASYLLGLPVPAGREPGQPIPTAPRTRPITPCAMARA